LGESQLDLMPQGLLYILPSLFIFRRLILSSDDRIRFDASENEEVKTKNKNKKKKNIFDLRWIIKVFIISFVVSIVLALLSERVISSLSLFFAFLILIFFIVIGIVFDIIGIAVTTADEKPFHSMAARKIKAGKKAVALIKNAERVSSFCNDIIGDISGVISGATGATIAAKLFTGNVYGFWGNLLFTAFISAFIVCGKASFKGIAIKYNNKFVYVVAKILCLFDFKK